MVFHYRFSDSVRIGSVEPGQVLAAVGDLLAEGMNPIERVEPQNGVCGHRVKGNHNLDAGHLSRILCLPRARRGSFSLETGFEHGVELSERGDDGSGD